MSTTVLIEIIPTPGKTPATRLLADIERDADAMIACRVLGLAAADAVEYPRWVYDPFSGALPEGLKLRPEGSPFQRAVWDALLTIPAGETRSYSDIATAIGRPTAVRAVGHACGANPIAVWIPCHRVCRRDGGLGGYRWGGAIKQALLESENARTAPPEHATAELL